MIGSIVAVIVGVIVLVFHKRLVRAADAAGVASARELGGPVAWFNDPPPGSIRARILPVISLASVLIVGVAFVVIGTLDILS